MLRLGLEALRLVLGVTSSHLYEGGEGPVERREVLLEKRRIQFERVGDTCQIRAVRATSTECFLIECFLGVAVTRHARREARSERGGRSPRPFHPMAGTLCSHDSS